MGEVNHGDVERLVSFGCLLVSVFRCGLFSLVVFFLERFLRMVDPIGMIGWCDRMVRWFAHLIGHDRDRIDHMDHMDHIDHIDRLQ